MKRKDTRRLLRRLCRLEKLIDEAWCEHRRSDSLSGFREALDLAIFQLGVAKGELIKQAARK